MHIQPMMLLSDGNNHIIISASLIYESVGHLTALALSANPISSGDILPLNCIAAVILPGATLFVDSLIDHRNCIVINKEY